MADYSRLVYSTDGGRTADAAPRSRRPRPDGLRVPEAPDDGVVGVFRDRGGRKGRAVTLVTGLPPARRDAVASELKRAAAAGGVIREGVVEIQGDHREMVVARLTSLGFRVKIAGG